jgi:Ca-activated chloride channel homolog
MRVGRRDFIRALPLLPVAVSGTRMSSGQTSESVGRSPMFLADSTQILIPFTAEDKRHHLVHGLTSHDIRLLADGREEHISFLHEEEGPTSLLFVLDISRSMKKPLADAQEAMRRVLRAAAADDEFAVVEFNDGAGLTVDFTRMQSRVEEHISRMAATGPTSLTDALVVALGEIRRANHKRRALIVMSDGGDNHSRHVASEVMRLAIETDARIYSIELYPPLGEGFSGPTMLERLAELTGGRYLPTVRRTQIPELIQRIDIHQGYVLGFIPPIDQRDGKLHQVELKMRRKMASDSVRLYWRRRYLVPSTL